MRKIIASLDIGSSLIKLVVAEAFKDKFNILLALNTPSQGVKNGYIVNPESFNVAVSDLFRKANDIIGIKIRKVIVNVPSNNIKVEVVEGSTTITNEEYIVGANDIVRAMQASVYNKIADNYELINVIPILFRINDNDVVHEPIGIGAEKLSVKCVLLSAPKKGIEPIIKVLEENHIEIIDFALTALGDYEQLSTKYTDEECGAIINIGGDTTTVSIFNKGVITNTEAINIGANNIDKDFSYLYKITPKDAIYLKENLSLCHTRLALPSETIELDAYEDGKIRLNQYEVSNAMMERIKEIFNLAKKQINLLTKKEISYIIITGGLSEAADFDIIMEESFGNVAYLADVKDIGARSNIYSAAIGMIKFYYRKLKLRKKDFSIFTLDEQEEFSGLGKNKSNSEGSLLSKVFGIFFDN